MMTDEEMLLECKKEIFRLRALVRKYGGELDERDNPANMAKEFQRLLFAMLPKQPRSESVDDDPGFWTDGDLILCPSEFETKVIANFLEDVFSEFSSIITMTGYYDPDEDKESGTVDGHTGFYYIDFC